MKHCLGKRQFISLIGGRLNHRIHQSHINDILSLLIDEINMELSNNKEIRIPNFCILKLEKSKPRKFHNVRSNKMEFSRGKILLKVKLSEKLKSIILNQIDLAKTFL